MKLGNPYSKNPKASADRARRTTSNTAYTRLVNELIFWAALRRNPKKNQTKSDNFYSPIYSSLASFAALGSSEEKSKENSDPTRNDNFIDLCSQVWSVLNLWSSSLASKEET